MYIDLRVVGIQFQKKKIKISKKNPTIEDVMLAAGGGASDFKFTKAPDGTLHSASAHIPNTTSISSGRKIAAGLYSLSDGLVGDNHISTWQWYLIRNKKQVNLPNGNIEKFSKKLPSEYKLKNGDKIVWRLVIVLNKPTIPKSKSAFSAKAKLLA